MCMGGNILFFSKNYLMELNLIIKNAQLVPLAISYINLTSSEKIRFKTTSSNSNHHLVDNRSDYIIIFTLKNWNFISNFSSSYHSHWYLLVRSIESWRSVSWWWWAQRIKWQIISHLAIIEGCWQCWEVSVSIVNFFRHFELLSWVLLST